MEVDLNCTGDQGTSLTLTWEEPEVATCGGHSLAVINYEVTVTDLKTMAQDFTETVPRSELTYTVGGRGNRCMEY